MKTLYAHQQRIIDKAPKRCLLCWSTGTGKSMASMALLKKHGVGYGLFVVPKALKEKWRRDLNEYVKNDFMWTVVSKEEFRKDWDSIPKHDAIVIDEAHYFSGMKSQMSKSAIAYINKHKVQYIYPLTATPFMSTPWNVYRLAQILGCKWNYMTFLNKFFYHIKMGSRMIPAPRKNMEPVLAKMVSIIGDVVSMDECIDMPEQIIESEVFETNKEQLEERAEVSMKETNPVVKYTKYHQIENGSLKGDEYNDDKIIPADKHDRILEIAMANKKIAVFCRYNLQIDSLHSLLKENGKKVHLIRGDVVNRDEVVQEIANDEECVVLINAACSEGYELASIGVIIFASLSFSYKDYVQARGRFLRINNPKRNVYIHLINKDSVDEAVHESIMNKQDFDLAIYAKNKLN